MLATVLENATPSPWKLLFRPLEQTDYHRLLTDHQTGVVIVIIVGRPGSAGERRGERRGAAGSAGERRGAPGSVWEASGERRLYLGSTSALPRPGGGSGGRLRGAIS